MWNVNPNRVWVEKWMIDQPNSRLVILIWELSYNWRVKRSITKTTKKKYDTINNGDTDNVDGDEFPEMEAEKNPEGDSGVENEEEKQKERKAAEERQKEENLKTLFKGCKFFLGREVNRWSIYYNR